jgi:2-iminoacetate synthase
MDYASPETKEVGEKLINKQLADIPRDRTREIVVERLEKIAAGERDFRF